MLVKEVPQLDGWVCGDGGRFITYTNNARLPNGSICLDRFNGRVKIFVGNIEKPVFDETPNSMEGALELLDRAVLWANTKPREPEEIPDGASEERNGLTLAGLLERYPDASFDEVIADPEARGLLEAIARAVIIARFDGSEYMAQLVHRAMHTEIGELSGHISAFDQAFARNQKLEPLNDLEKWFLADLIKDEKRRR